MCAFGTLTCGEMGIGPKSPLLLAVVVAFRIIESAVVVDDRDVDSDGEMALALLLLLLLLNSAEAVKCIFGLDG